MLLTLKNITFSESLSEETNAFTADVYLNGVKRATASNHGQGGPTDVCAYAKWTAEDKQSVAYLAQRNANQEFLDQYNAWAAQQPAIESELEMASGRKISYPHDLELDVDLCLSEWLKGHNRKKEEARQKRLCRTNWAFRLTEHKGQPCDAGTFFLQAKRPGQTLGEMSAKLRAQYGEQLLEIFNTRYI